MSPNTAILTNEGNMTVFQYGEQRIKFRAPDCLDHYVQVKTWDNGYIVALTSYKGIGVEEEYIDLLPILHNLYIDADSFLSQINKVIVK